MRILCRTLLLLALSTSLSATAELPTSDQARRLFNDPSRHHSNGPLWVWNDMLTEAQIRETLRDMARENVKQVWVHPRPGLMTPYLSKEWFDLWKVALREAEKLDMNVWIYDENSYPSGFAGGFVPETMPESRGRGISFRDSTTAPGWDTNIIAVYLMHENHAENVTARIKEGKKLPTGSYLTVQLAWADNRAWHGNRFYVNLLSPGVTEKFMEVTYGPYEKELKKHFGKRIPGIFTDEPNIRPVHGTLPWSEVLAAEFQKRWGYDLLEHLPSLTRKVGDWRKVRHNYFQVLNEQFIERWAKPNFEYCEKNNLEWTGHYWDHDWPECIGVPDNMAMYAWHQRPAIDCLMNQYRETTDAQFGNVRMVRELSSVANQLGIKRTLCEAYGAAGWELRFEDMKRIGDWLQVLGVNTINEHLSYVTIRGARKRDHPQSFSYHEPWWESYHVIADYFARLSAALSQGEQVNRILVLEPTTTAWMYQDDHARLGELGKSFFDLLMALEAAQIEYDLVSEDILARFGKPGAEKILIANRDEKSRTLRVGQRDYDRLIIPPFTENLNRSTQELLQQVAITTHVPGSLPSRVDGVLTGKEQSFTWIRTNSATWVRLLIDRIQCEDNSPVRVERSPGDQGVLFHMRRQLKDGQLLFLVNTSDKHSSHAVVLSRLPGIEQWNLHTGEIKPYPAVSQSHGVSAKIEIPPSGSLLLLLNNKSAKREFPADIAQEIPASSSTAVKRVRENVLTLDYVTVIAGGKTLTNSYFYKAGQFVWKQHGLNANPWDSAVQFKDELISKTFPPGSGFEATYEFTIEGAPPEDLQVVVEKPELYSISFNGEPVKSSGWWLDKAFGRMNVGTLARTGKNTLTIKAARMTMFHELEPAYVLGSFSLKPAASGFVIAEDAPLELGKIRKTQGHSFHPDGTMWLSEGVDFRPNLEDRAPWLLFELGAVGELSGVKIWNYNEAHVRDLSERGARTVRILSGQSRDGVTNVVGVFELTRGNKAGLPQTIEQKVEKARFIKFEFLANHAGATFPFQGKGLEDGNANAMVGLAEVQFISPVGKPVKARVAARSSELSGFGRLAKHVIDGSGFSSGKEGWNHQGHPFYGDAVAYTQSFEVEKSRGRFLVQLPSWNGSVAQVRVNGKMCGYIVSPPYECDVTKAVKHGRNEVRVDVIGTLKNTLGPHHGSPNPGSAWPGHFRVGPDQGPPSGTEYSTIGYGLFEPIRLKNVVSQQTVTASR